MAPPPSPAAAQVPEQVLLARRGAVLGAKTVLKSDHFPGCQNRRLLPHIDGAPNYRQVDDLPIYGVAIPTVEGIRNVLHFVGTARDDGARTLWHNIREEPVRTASPHLLRSLPLPRLSPRPRPPPRPGLAWLGRLPWLGLLAPRAGLECGSLGSGPMVLSSQALGVIYINGRPFVLREVERPFSNLEYTGIDRARVEEMESRLKQDVLDEAARHPLLLSLLIHLYKNKVMVSDELPDGQMVDQWEPIGPDSVQTPLEVYESLQAEGYKVDYERVPVTDEKSPKERDFDLLVHRLAQVDVNTRLLFNCQMGRGRTTTGMVVATLIHLCRTRSLQSPPALAVAHSESPRKSFAAFKDDFWTEEGHQKAVEEKLRLGEYSVIRSLTRVLQGGAESKRIVDAAIDKCSAMQNLREAILGYRNGIHRQADEKKREAALSNFVEYLERYYFLICFAVYLHTNPYSLKGQTPIEGGFQAWMKDRPELYSILRRLLRRDPMGALDYSSGPYCVISPQKKLHVVRGRELDMETVVGSRDGGVLGRHTVLKSDHCPGCQNLHLPERVDGAPNFREVAGFPVYGVANPTVEGIREVLARIGAGVGGRNALWHNMREEPVVYINGKPFVLRELERPFKNMLEYTGIDRGRVEQMEARLKEDVLREAAQYDNTIMVNHESETGEIYDMWEPVSADSVLTPLEVYQRLQAEGYHVEYERVPITDGKAPKSRDFDVLATRIAPAGKDTALVFNCQMGRGRTTTGTVIACLVHMRVTSGRPLCMPRLTSASSDVEGTSSSDSEEDKEKENGTVTPQQQTPYTDPRLSYKPGGASPFTEAALPKSTPDLLAVKPPRPQVPEREEDREQAETVDVAVPERTLKHQPMQLRRSVGSFGSLMTPTMRQPSLIPGFTMDDIQIIRNLTRLLDNGAESREILDAVIDRCAAMQNLRQAILRYRRTFNQQKEDHRQRRNALSRGIEYLERYYMLIAFAAYLGSDAATPRMPSSDSSGASAGEVLSFKAWIRRRPEIRHMKWSMRLRPARVFTVPEVDTRSQMHMEQEDALMEGVVKARSGSVLGKQSILKMYFFPGQQSKMSSCNIDGAPHIGKVQGFPVHSMATPTIGGARAILSHLHSRPPKAGEEANYTIITDLREEAVVYIDGMPFVLRESNQPVSTYKHVGIEGPVVEEMEERMKADILNEAAQYNGQVLLHREVVNEAHGGSDVIGYWDIVVLTSLRWASQAEYLFVSHTGFGGVAYAMAIACVRLQADAELSALSPDANPRLLGWTTSLEASASLRTSVESPHGASLTTTAKAHATLSPKGKEAVADLHVSVETTARIPGVKDEKVIMKLEHKTEAGGAEVLSSLALLNGHQPDSKREVPDDYKQGNYRDVLSLERVLPYGPASKLEVDSIIHRCAAAGNLLDDIYRYKKDLDNCGAFEEDHKAYLQDMGLKALRRYCYLIVFRSFLYTQIAQGGSSLAGQMPFSHWMHHRPELGILCDHLKLK
eukprot:SM000277S10347  [mRNA]  locus=s277:33301:42396:- [translate_table: standard]